MPELQPGSCEIDPSEMINQGNSEHKRLELLKAKGAPVIGDVGPGLEMDDRYILTSTVVHKYTWTPK